MPPGAKLLCALFHVHHVLMFLVGNNLYVHWGSTPHNNNWFVDQLCLWLLTWNMSFAAQIMEGVNFHVLLDFLIIWL